MSGIAQRTASRLRTVAVRTRRRLQTGSADAESDRRWNVVTIDATPEEVMPGGQPPPMLADLGDAVEVDVRPAPGGRGTELQARLTRHVTVSPTAEVTQGSLRQVLRQTKQLFEVGEVLQSLPRPEGKRSPTPAGKLVDAAEAKSDQEGVL